MGYFKSLDIDRIQRELNQHEAEKISRAYLQPTLGEEFSDYPEALTLLDFVKVFNQRRRKIERQNQPMAFVN